jgi:hypothetical protein
MQRREVGLGELGPRQINVATRNRDRSVVEQVSSEMCFRQRLREARSDVVAYTQQSSPRERLKVLRLSLAGNINSGHSVFRKTGSRRGAADPLPMTARPV